MRRPDDNAAIPDGWQMVRLGDVAEVVGGSTPSRKQDEYWGGDIPWVVPSELTQLSGRHLTSTRESVTSTGMLAAGLRIIPAKSILLTSRATIGAVAMNAVPLTTNQGFQSLIPRCGTHGLWLYYWIASMRHELEKRGSGSTFREVSRDSIRTLPLLLPPLTEQRRIAAMLDAIDNTIERTNDVIAATERLRDALLHDLLSHGVPGWHSEWRDVPSLGTIPADWEVATLGNLLVLDQPGAWGDEPTPTNLGVRVLRAANLTRDGQVSPCNAARRRLSKGDLHRRVMRDGDLILERSGGGPGTPVGRIALIDGLGSIYCNNFCQQLRVDHTRCGPPFAARALWHRYLRGVTARLEHRTTGIRNLDYAGYLSFPFPLPTLREQQTIVATLTTVDKAIDRASDERGGLQALKASTADALLSGRVRVSSGML